jgi:hypothetical protein
MPPVPSDIDQVRLTLQRLQDGYTRRDVTILAEFMQLFADEAGLEVIGSHDALP